MIEDTDVVDHIGSEEAIIERALLEVAFEDGGMKAEEGATHDGLDYIFDSRIHAGHLTCILC